MLFAAATLLCSTTFAQIQKGAISIGGSLGASSSKNTQSNQYYFEGLGYDLQDDPNLRGSSLLFNFNPQIGYFITDKFALGIVGGVSYAPEKQERTYHDNNDYKTKMMELKQISYSWNAGVFGRYYFPLGEKAYFGLETNIGYSEEKVKAQDVDYRTNDAGVYSYFTTDYFKQNTSSVSVGFKPSILLFPGKKWGLEFSLDRVLGYASSKHKFEFTSATGTVERPSILKDIYSVRSNDILFGFSSMNPSIGLYYYIKKG